MGRFVRSLRFNLAMLYLTVFGVIQTGLCMGILVVREQHMRREFDEWLIDRAMILAEHMQMAKQAEPEGHLAYSLPAVLNSQRFSGVFVQVRRPDGTIIARSGNLGQRELPGAPNAASRTRLLDGAAVSFQTIAGEPAITLFGSDDPIRVLTYEELGLGDASFCLQVGRSLSSVRAGIDAMRDIFIVAIPLGLLAAGTASWFVARRSLSPLGRIVRQAREITATDLHRRLDLPPGNDEVAELVGVINQMLDRLEAAFRAQERFIANVSHELKTPLAVLLGEAQVLAGRARSVEEYRAFLGSVEDEMRRLTRIVHSLLMLAQSDAGLPLPYATPVAINEVVGDAVRRCDQLARLHKNSVVPRLLMPERHDDASPMTQGDSDLLATAVENLLRNAIRFSPPGGRIEVEVGAEEKYVTISVRDQGPGIRSEFMDKVFDRFFHLPGGDVRFAGTGLGLAIVKGVVELHRGTVEVANLNGCGCVFQVRLPRIEAELQRQ